jgi:hypothetical protein
MKSVITKPAGHTPPFFLAYALAIMAMFQGTCEEGTTLHCRRCRMPNPTSVAVAAATLLLLFGFIQFLRITTVNFDMLELNNPKLKSIAGRCKPYMKEHYLVHSSGIEIIFPPKVIHSVLDISKSIVMVYYIPRPMETSNVKGPESVFVTCRSFVCWHNVFPLLFQDLLTFKIFY